MDARKVTIALVAALFHLAAPPPARAGSSDAAGGGDPFRLRIDAPMVIHMKGGYDEPDEATYTIGLEPRDGRALVHALWVTEAKRIEFWLEAGTGLPVETLYEKRKSAERVRILYEGREAAFEYVKGTERRKTRVRAKSVLYEALALDVLLMGFPFDAPGRIEFSIVDADSRDGDAYEAYVEVEGRTKAMVADREVDCVDLLFALSGLAGLVAPKYHFLYEAAPPHRYVSYRGPAERFTVTALVP